MTIENLAAEFLGIIPTPQGSWSEIKEDFEKRIKEYTQEKLIEFKTWEVDNDIKNLTPEQMAEWFMEDIE